MSKLSLRDRAGTVVLMYHRLGDGRLPGDSAGEHVYAVAPGTFEAQLELLRTNGAVLPLSALSAPGRPTRSVVITFDDGNASDHSVALPALQKHGLTAAFFITPAWVGKPGHLDWPQVRELMAAGMTVGAHGLDHKLLATLEPDELRANLVDSRKLFEARLGSAPSWLSLPGGAGSTREVRAAREAGYGHVMGSVPGLARFDSADPLPRFAVRRHDSLATFRALVEQRPGARLRHWGRHRMLWALRRVLGRGVHERLRSAWAASLRDE